MQSLFKEETYTGDFTIDFSKINKCKGVVYLEVKPITKNKTLRLNNFENDIISIKKPYKLESNHPIVNGVLSFKAADLKTKSVVRLLLIQ